MSIFNRVPPTQPVTVAEASLASLQSSIEALRQRHAILTYEIGIRQDELAEVADQLRVLEPALEQITSPFAIELTMMELTHDE